MDVLTRDEEVTVVHALPPTLSNLAYPCLCLFSGMPYAVLRICTIVAILACTQLRHQTVWCCDLQQNQLGVLLAGSFPSLNSSCSTARTPSA